MQYIIAVTALAVCLSGCDAGWIPGYGPQKKASDSTCEAAVALAGKREDLSRDCQKVWDEQGRGK